MKRKLKTENRNECCNFCKPSRPIDACPCLESICKGNCDICWNLNETNRRTMFHIFQIFQTNFGYTRSVISIASFPKYKLRRQLEIIAMTSMTDICILYIYRVNIPSHIWLLFGLVGLLFGWVYYLYKYILWRYCSFTFSCIWLRSFMVNVAWCHRWCGAFTMC